MDQRILGFREVMERVDLLNAKLDAGFDRYEIMDELTVLQAETYDQGYTIKIVPLGPNFITVSYNSRYDKTNRWELMRGIYKTRTESQNTVRV